MPDTPFTVSLDSRSPRTPTAPALPLFGSTQPSTPSTLTPSTHPTPTPLLFTSLLTSSPPTLELSALLLLQAPVLTPSLTPSARRITSLFLLKASNSTSKNGPLLLLENQSPLLLLIPTILTTCHTLVFRPTVRWIPTIPPLTLILLLMRLFTCNTMELIMVITIPFSSVLRFPSKDSPLVLQFLLSSATSTVLTQLVLLLQLSV